MSFEKKSFCINVIKEEKLLCQKKWIHGWEWGKQDRKSDWAIHCPKNEWEWWIVSIWLGGKNQFTVTQAYSLNISLLIYTYSRGNNINLKAWLVWLIMMQEENVNLKINVGKRKLTVFDGEKSELFKLYVNGNKLGESILSWHICSRWDRRKGWRNVKMVQILAKNNKYQICCK